MEEAITYAKKYLEDISRQLVKFELISRAKLYSENNNEFKEKLKALSPSGIPIIVSGIPLSLMTPEIEDQVLRTTKELIGQRGKFIIYQHHPNIYKKIANVFPKYEKYFEPLNFPPYIILVARNQ
jgi:phospholipid N-methyltransferase